MHTPPNPAPGEPSDAKQRRFFANTDPRKITILLIIFVQIVGASMVLPLLPLYARREFALNPNVITLLVASFFAAQFVAGPFIGRLSDRYGRVPVLLISQVGTVISFLMLGAAQSVAVLLFSRILDGVTGGNIIVAQAYITDITPKEERTQALGLLFAAFGLGFVIGPALGGILSAGFGPRIPFFFAAIAASIVVWLTWRNLDETLTPEQRERNRTAGKGGGLAPGEVIRNPPLMMVLLVGFAGQFGLGLVQGTLALYGEAILFEGYSQRVTDIGIGLLLATIGFGQLFTQLYLLKRLLARFGDSPLVLMGSFLRGIGMYILAVIVVPYPGVLAMIAFAIGSGLMMPTLQSLSTRTVGEEVRGGVLGLYQSAISLSTIFSVALSGTLFNIHPTVPYYLGGTMFMLVLIPSYFLMRQSQAGELASKPAPTAAD